MINIISQLLLTGNTSESDENDVFKDVDDFDLYGHILG